MSKEDLATHCKQRFKGIENFLRRVAFNLGNSPSQTEVKIISCIPIDVSDLQQKIINLEKQLNEATVGRNHENNTSCATALYTGNYRKASNSSVTCNCNEVDFNTSRLEEPSNLTFTALSRNKSTVSINAGPSYGNCFCNSDISGEVSPNYKTQPLIICEPQKEKRRNFFSKKKKLLKKKKVKTHFVYYAQTSNGPFRDTDKWNVLDEMERNMSDGVTRAYLTDMIRKQYRPKTLGRNFSSISESSSPVCRDTPQGCSRHCPYESEVCSCCHGQFHNIDNQRNREPQSNPSYLHQTNTRSSYYDSSLYDLVPVKEKSVKVKKDFEMPFKKEVKPKIELMCWPKEDRTIPRFSPIIVNYHTISPTRNNCIKNIPRKLKEKDTVVEKMMANRKKAKNFSQQIDIISSKSCCVQYGNVYSKRMRNIKPKTVRVLKVHQPQRKDVECLTTVINNTECQTVTSNAEVKKSEANTEATLNQIKSILQSVLTEVKTNNQIKNSSEGKTKKDAVVQKEASQSNLEGSTFLNSFTYSPYKMNPYIASRSQQMNSSHFCYPQTTMKYLQNFPLIIQSGRHMCNSCYRNNSNIKSTHHKQANTTSTNTDEVKARSKETDKLIKEIYKSMAINADQLNKDASYSEYENLKSVYEFENKLIEEPEVEIMKKVGRAISEVCITKKIQTTSERNAYNKFTTNTVSTKSQSISTDTEKADKRVKTIMQRNNKQSVSVSTAVEIRTPPEEELDVITATESESTSDVESDATYVPKNIDKVPHVQKNEKKSLFSKMFKSVFKTKDKPKIPEPKIETDTDSTSDSDDYQTIYSQKIDKPKYQTRAVNLTKLKTHSKILDSKKTFRDRSPEGFRTSPGTYMEQEYRRHWNERLMFDTQKQMYSSERPVSKSTKPEKPVYYQKYEARTATVEPRRPHYPRECAQETVRPYYEKNNPERPYFGKDYGQNRPYIQRDSSPGKTSNFNTKTAKGLAWLKKHKMGIHCGEQWKKLILES